MERDFNTVIDRKNTNSLKYDFAVERGMPEQILPLWVADMDFQVPQPVSERLEAVSRMGIYGYSEAKEKYFEAVAGWYQQYHDWRVKPEWLIKTPGVVFGIAMAVRALTQPGDAVMIQPPVYYPFRQTVLLNDRKLVNNPLVEEAGLYRMNVQEFEEKIISEQVKVFILCSPHNPVGRVWTAAELQQIGDICVRHKVYVISDEIHADFVYQGHQHTVFANLSAEIAALTITCTAPSKTFNLAGLQISNLFISDPKVRGKIEQEISKTGYDQVNLMGLVACEAAYEEGRQWLDELNAYLADNLAFVRTYVKEYLPEIRLVEPEGTYLVWLDFRKLQLSEIQKRELIVERAGLWLDAGSMFGQEGKGFERINIACPRTVLEQALNQLKAALKQMLSED